MLFERFYVRDGRQSLPSATPLVQTPSGVIAILVAFLSSLVPARRQAASSSYTAEFYVAGCKDFLAGKSSFFGGRCVGAIEVLNALNDDTKLFCPPEGATNLQRVQVVVDCIEKRPDRKNADFRLVKPGRAKNSLRGTIPAA